jgi:predicted nucleotidyltransferase
VNPEPAPGPGSPRDMTRLDLGELRTIAGGQAYPLLFATVSGAHLYGFPSRDSDVDLRGVHLLPAAEVVGLWHGPETLTRSWTSDGAEIDLVTHDAAKFFRLLLRRNGYVLEQLLSPLVVVIGEAHRALIDLAPAVLTRSHAHHYRRFARTQWALFARTGALKPLLYTFRVLLTGFHLMRAGKVEAHLPTLTGLVPEAPAYLRELVDAKTEHEHIDLAATATGVTVAARAQADVAALHRALDDAQHASKLPGAIRAARASRAARTATPRRARPGRPQVSLSRTARPRDPMSPPVPAT